MKQNKITLIGAIFMILAGAFELYYAGILNQNISIVAIICFCIATVCFIIGIVKKRK